MRNKLTIFLKSLIVFLLISQTSFAMEQQDESKTIKIKQKLLKKANKKNYPSLIGAIVFQMLPEEKEDFLTGLKRVREEKKSDNQNTNEIITTITAGDQKYEITENKWKYFTASVTKSKKYIYQGVYGNFESLGVSHVVLDVMIPLFKSAGLKDPISLNIYDIDRWQKICKTSLIIQKKPVEVTINAVKSCEAIKALLSDPFMMDEKRFNQYKKHHKALHQYHTMYPGAVNKI